MKGFIFGLALLVAGFTHAETVTPLQIPPPAYNGAPHFSCEGTSFDASDNLDGYCATSVGHSSGGRGGSISYTWTVYAASWSVDGDITGLLYCGTWKTPVNMFSQPPVYAPGYSAANCRLPVGNVGPFVLIGSLWYTITGYSSDGACEAAASNGGPVVVKF